MITRIKPRYNVVWGSNQIHRESDRLIQRYAATTRTKAKVHCVLAVDRVIDRIDRNGQVSREYLNPNGMQFRGGRNSVVLVDSTIHRSVEDVIGSVRDIRIDRNAGRLVGAIHFAASKFGQECETKVREGHITHIDIVCDYLEGGNVPAGETYRSLRGPFVYVERWQPVYVAFCVCPASIDNEVLI